MEIFQFGVLENMISIKLNNPYFKLSIMIEIQSTTNLGLEISNLYKRKSRTMSSPGSNIIIFGTIEFRTLLITSLGLFLVYDFVNSVHTKM